MKTCKSTNLIKFYNEGVKRVSKLMQQRNFDHAFVIVDLLKRQPLSEYENLKANVESYCEIYPEETWALEFINNKKKIATHKHDFNTEISPSSSCNMLANKRAMATMWPAMVKTR